MEKNMKVNFEYLKGRVVDTFDNTDTEFINYELSKLDKPTLVSGIGGSSVVSDFGAKVLSVKNSIVVRNTEPRDMIYMDKSGYSNVIACSYSGNNFGVDLSFDNNLKKYLLSRNTNEEAVNLQYKTTIDNERSFISLGATLIPISVLINYYLNGDESFLDDIEECVFSFDTECDVYEIFSGYDTSTTSKYLESTMVESGIGIPIVHDKYSYCHGRSTMSINNNSIAIFLNRNTELDRLLLREISKYYKNVIVIDGKYKDMILDDYQMLVQAMYLTKFIAESKSKDLSKVEYSPLCKTLYKCKFTM
jgi:hypothetical protein